MYTTDSRGGNQPQTALAHSLVPRNVMTLPARGNSPKDLLAGPVAFSCASGQMASHGGSGCTNCASCRSAKGMGDLTTDLSTLGLGGYVALGLGAFLLTKILFTGGRAKQRRAALRKVDEEFRARRAAVAAQYPRI